MSFSGRQMRSTIDANGTLTLSLENVTVGEPGDEEIVVRVEAAPINPSDLGLMLGPADISTMRASGRGDAPMLQFAIPESRRAAVRNRMGLSLPIGNEGAGTVVAAGRNVRELEGRRVGMFGGAMFADYRKIDAREAVPLPAGASAMDGAAMFVNPLTALGFVDTARREGHGAIVHTAAASSLGQMLQKICLADGIPLVNIVRSEQQAEILRALGASHVLDSRADGFAAQLADAIEQTGATIAFDAVGGGSLGSTIMRTMEEVAVRMIKSYDRYGSDRFKQLYIYGALDPSPTILERLAFGFQWSVSGWLLPPYLRKIGDDAAAGLRARVVRELGTTFASRYTRVVGLADVLDPDVLRACERKATGEKFLIDPTRR